MPRRRDWFPIIPLIAFGGCGAEAPIAGPDPSAPGIPVVQPAPALFSPVDLGTLPGGTTSLAWGLNDRGDVVGIAELGGVALAFLKLSGAPMVALPSAVRGSAAEAFDINNLQLSVGWSATTTGRQAALWSGVRRPKLLGTLGGAQSDAVAINDLNQAVGTSEIATGQNHAFLWDPGAGMVDLGTLGGSYAQAYAINELGVVTGCSSLANGEIHPFIWDAAAGMQDIGVPGKTHCGHGINRLGLVVGEWIQTTVSLAALWDGVSWVPLFRRGSSFGSAINDRGSSVGTVTSGAGPLPFFRSQTGAISTLPLLAGGVSGQAMAINRCDMVAGVVSTSLGWRATTWNSGC